MHYTRLFLYQASEIVKRLTTKPLYCQQYESNFRLGRLL